MMGGEQQTDGSVAAQEEVACAVSIVKTFTPEL